MFIAYTVAAVLFAVLLTFSARAIASRNPHVMASLEAVQVPPRWYGLLAALKFAGALGLLAGIFWRPIGIAAAVGVVLYFLGAVISHLRVKDSKGVGGPAVLTLASLVPLTLGIAAA
ncbi:DoxX family protein [Streptomyces sp. NPDC002205]|uniref:DoxX family protein n=1 Tax=Streptomyces sp. NPDC002205 TaxID=3154411 RepID=UPI0033164C98